MPKQRRVSSRLIKRERKKLTNQIIWFSALAIVLMLFFLFVVMPIFVRVMNGILNTNPISQDTGTVYVQAPIISAPPTYTANPTLTVTGFSQPDSEVVMIINGKKTKTTTANLEGEFEASVALTEGENSIAAYSITDGDRESPTSKQFVVVLDTEVPIIELSSPEEGKTYNIKEESVAVSGKTDADARVYVNDRLVFPNSEGEFSTKYMLKSGDQQVTVKAVDQAGNEVEAVRQIKAE